MDTIKIIPHTIKPLRKVTIKPHKTINIGIIGAIGIHKGLDKIKNIDKVLPKYKNVKLIIIGYTSCDNSFENTEITGAYDVNDLPNIIEKFKIDVIFIPSICPETFSYTTEEAMSMGIPLACYNIGAPAERVCNYKKGIVINSMEDDEKTLTALIDCAKNWK
ncbi:MAG: glycosyltransferase [Alphaproteobacteria bacterium]|nr:glycosyltransferase [Alphaproteobacteria bacterium]